MSWFRRLLPQVSKPTKIAVRPEQSWNTMPTVTFDASTVSKSVKSNLMKNIRQIEDVRKKHVQEVYEAGLSCVLAGGNLHVLFTALMKIEDLSKDRAAEIARSLQKKAKAQIDRERQASLGITHAVWMYSNAPCMNDPSHPPIPQLQQDYAHSLANGKPYEVSKGLFIDNKWTWPGVEDGCKCTSRSILPGFE
jgi:hypothetical protein